MVEPDEKQDKINEDSVSSTEDYDKQLYEIYSKERSVLVQESITTIRSFDKSILAYSAGAIGLTVTFINEIFPPPLNFKYLLLMCWIFFILSVLTTTISFLISHKAFEKQIEILEETILDETENYGNIWSTITKHFNCFSIIFFIIGVTLLVVFAYLNL